MLYRISRHPHKLFITYLYLMHSALLNDKVNLALFHSGTPLMPTEA